MLFLLKYSYNTHIFLKIKSVPKMSLLALTLREEGYYRNIFTKVTLLAYFDNLMGHISALENSISYSKIKC
jgi:hypothetical protein